MPEELNGDLLLDLAVGAHRQKNLAHAAAAKTLLQPVRAAAETRRRELFQRFHESVRRSRDHLRDRCIQRVKLEKRFQFRPYVRRNLVLVEIAPAFRGSEVIHLAE